jgi:hypothetical protein
MTDRWTDLSKDDEYWAVLTVLRKHRYDYTKNATSSRPGDPGWNVCDCGWEGYWCNFQPHVAEELVKTLREVAA